MSRPRPSYPFETPDTVITSDPNRGAAGIVMLSSSARAVNAFAASHSSSYARSLALPFFCWPLALERTHSSSWLIVRCSESCFFPSASSRLDFESSQVE